MAKLLYSATMSLDGFIAGPDGDMGWMAGLPDSGPHPVADDLWPRVGALLAGARTYFGDDPNAGTDAEGAFGGQWSGPQFVLTHNPPADPVPDVTFHSDLSEAVAAARAAAGDRYVNVLGADVAAQCLDAGFLDEILVIVAPVLLGDGTALFRRPGGTNVALERSPRHRARIPASGCASLRELVYDDPLDAWATTPVLELDGLLDDRVTAVLTALGRP